MAYKSWRVITIKTNPALSIFIFMLRIAVCVLMPKNSERVRLCLWWKVKNYNRRGLHVYAGGLHVHINFSRGQRVECHQKLVLDSTFSARKWNERARRSVSSTAAVIKRGFYLSRITWDVIQSSLSLRGPRAQRRLGLYKFRLNVSISGTK